MSKLGFSLVCMALAMTCGSTSWMLASQIPELINNPIKDSDGAVVPLLSAILVVGYMALIGCIVAIFGVLVYLFWKTRGWSN